MESTLLAMIDSAKQTNALLADTVGSLKECVSYDVGGYLNKVTSIAYGTLSTCLGQVEMLKGDHSITNYEVLDAVFYSLKNFTLNQYRAGVVYHCWQDCWKDFMHTLSIRLD
ncbi:TPA: hypothetical protein PMB18_001623 [Vibrio cholerae]|nr:hypothetical protein [Vibrio cholerae]